MCSKAHLMGSQVSRFEFFDNVGNKLEVVVGVEPALISKGGFHATNYVTKPPVSGAHLSVLETRVLFLSLVGRRINC